MANPTSPQASAPAPQQSVPTPTLGQASQASTQAPQAPTPVSQQLDFSPRRRTQPVEQEKGPFIKYVGVASHRRIRPHQWKARFGGDESKLKDPQATHTWSIANKKLVPLDQFSDHQIDYLLCDDMQRGRGGHSFLLVDYDADGNLVQVQDKGSESK